MAQITVTQVIQLIQVADTLIAKIIDVVRNVKGLSKADEETLRAEVAEIRARNDAKFLEVDAILAAREQGT